MVFFLLLAGGTIAIYYPIRNSERRESLRPALEEDG